MIEENPNISDSPLRETITQKDQLAAGEIRPIALIPEDQTHGLAASSLWPREPEAGRITRWLMTHFGKQLRQAVHGGPFTPAHLCGIVCQETAYFWLPLLDRLQGQEPYKSQPEELVDLILERCVLDASGDHPDLGRSAFPKNTAAFREVFGSEFSAMLIAEANATRALRGFQPKSWIYKGYGIFQYDLQYVHTDEAFFRDRQWRDFDRCLEKVVGELKQKLKAQQGDVWEAIRAYNGKGPRAERYRDNVKIFSNWAQIEISKMPTAVASPQLAASSLAATLHLPKRPQLTQSELHARLAPFSIDRTTYPIVVVGIRGYYLDSMGLPGVNDRGIYDDALFIDSPDVFAAYNGNTDPSRVRRGHGFGDQTKGMASLKPGAWFVYRIDPHNGQYLALCQRAGHVTVIRDGIDEDYPHTGSFGINIHRGSYNGTSSLGCQTLHPDQWPSFINNVTDQAKRYFGSNWRKAVIPYVLLAAKA